MATLTAEQIEARKLQLKQLAREVRQLQEELVEAGAIELPDNELDQAAGGITYVFPGTVPPQIPVL